MRTVKMENVRLALNVLGAIAAGKQPDVPLTSVRGLASTLESVAAAARGQYRAAKMPPQRPAHAYANTAGIADPAILMPPPAAPMNLVQRSSTPKPQAQQYGRSPVCASPMETHLARVADLQARFGQNVLTLCIVRSVAFQPKCGFDVGIVWDGQKWTEFKRTHDAAGKETFNTPGQYLLPGEPLYTYIQWFSKPADAVRAALRNDAGYGVVTTQAGPVWRTSPGGYGFVRHPIQQKYPNQARRLVATDIDQ